MRSRAVIGIKYSDDSVGYIYCCLDGSPEEAGKTLLNCYNDEKSAQELLNIGDITSLEDSVKKNNEKKWGGPQHTKWLDLVDINSQLGADYLYIFDIKKRKWKWFDVYNFNDLTLDDVSSKETPLN